MSSTGDDDLSSVGSSDNSHIMESTTRTKSDGENASSSGDNAAKAADELQQTTIKREEHLVRGARILVCSIIVICAAAVCFSIYYFGSVGDKRSFESEYESITRDIESNVLWEVRYNMALMEQLSSAITSFAIATQATFPFVTDKNFEVTGGYADGMGGIKAVAFAPLVTSAQRSEWETYSVDNQDWLRQAKLLQVTHPFHRDALHGTIQDHEHDRHLQEGDMDPIVDMIYKWDGDMPRVEPSVEDQVYAPIWQMSPPQVKGVNVNLLSDPRIRPLYQKVVETRWSVMSSPLDIDDMLLDFWFDEGDKHEMKIPHALLLEPVFANFVEANAEIVGVVLGITSYGNLVSKLVPDDASGIYAVFEDTCGIHLTFELDGPTPVFLGNEDMHPSGYDHYKHTLHNIQMYDKISNDTCVLDLHIYPSTPYENSFKSDHTILFVSVVCLAVVIVVFLVIYDTMVNRRHQKTVQTAARTQAIITNLFPKEVGRKIIEEAAMKEKRMSGRANLKNLLTEEGKKDAKASQIADSKPIADLFPEVTIMFADMVGFTAWSSVREPCQVFQLLETIFAAFDDIAQRRRVFKVETVGDCYVAVSGLPTPRKDHATVMCRFARDCLMKTQVLFTELEVELGPDTADLGMRIGLHSGPVTAGVLRGQKARFQLFGDTMNTTARVESSGMKNRIHISKETADLLTRSGKRSWLKERGDLVEAKGKGVMKTFWLDVTGGSKSVTSGSSNCEPVAKAELVEEKPAAQTSPTGDAGASLDTRKLRLVDWNVEVLAKALKEIVARREANARKGDSEESISQAEKAIREADRTPLDELQEIITLPKFDKKAEKRQINASQVKIDPKAIDQLRAYVKVIASMYRENPFHNFEHASHVTMSVTKLLGRIVAPDVDDIAGVESDDAKTLHDYTYGINGDPLTQFSCCLAALMHDADHVGVPNTQLQEENPTLSSTYKNKSIAEQNSVELCWDLLMDPEFKDLRRTIYGSVEELHRFRNLVVNSILATDIMDKQLGADRKHRWNKAFSEEALDTQHTTQEAVNRKATIVIEHLIQASDVAHTMQHWHVYRKWNGNLFEELYKAYIEGRAQVDPSTVWYKGELGFYDFYIIPLAKKLKSCGVFGVSSDEYLNYAEKNRQEWEVKGEQVVAELIQKCVAKYGNKEETPAVEGPLN